jgi:hypothetical protein
VGHVDRALHAHAQRLRRLHFADALVEERAELAHALDGHAEAARRGIICGYKVIISVITSEMVTNELLSRGEVVVNGDAVRARQVATGFQKSDGL